MLPSQNTLGAAAAARPVRILEDPVVNQIAAGEVVERPASVIKELVENSIDAGAGSITVLISNGGRTLIEVVDDGCGMTKEDALLAIQRFGTSKISSVDDLTGISTHGFRGEALPSIAAVSQFRLSTCTAGGTGVEVTIDGGVLSGAVDLPLPQGTRVSVCRLFFNVPARRAFLKSEKSEEGLIRSLLLDFAAAYPERRFRLVRDDDEVMTFPAAASLDERLADLKIVGRTRVTISDERLFPEGKYRVDGLLTRPEEAIRGSGRLRLLVNSRSVRDRLVVRAVRDGYGNFLRGEQYPAGILRVSVPPEEVDVNVHPQKTEVRFRTPDKVFALVQRAVSDALRRASVGAVPASSETFPAREETRAPVFFTGTGFLPQHEAPEVADSAALTFGPAKEVRDPSVLDHISSFRHLGQLFECYLLFEFDGRFLVLDMHAAHERVRFFRLKNQLTSGKIVEQLLAIPEVVDLPPQEMGRFAEFQPEFARLGFEVEPFGESQVVIRSVPALLGSVSPSLLLNDLFSLPDVSRWDLEVSNRHDQAIARLACHSSVRSGHLLSREEAFHLLQELREAELSAFCPHGRPVLIAFTKTEIEGRFGR